MGWTPSDDHHATERAEGPIELVIVPRTRDIGGFEVRRALPSAKRRMVGPFVFLDRMGPAVFQPGMGIDVRAHPHIGLATVTYLFEGGLMHRDSLGTELEIRPGAVNWMTAGSGIAHSERTPGSSRAGVSRASGVQTWVALPERFEEVAPSFVHHAAADLPVIGGEGKEVRLIAGALYGARSPVETYHETIYADVTLKPGARLPVPPAYDERAIFTIDGVIDIAGDRFEGGQLLVLRPGDDVTVTAPPDEPMPARFQILGGEPMDGPRHIWWNFVSSSLDRIEQAKADWKAGRFQPVPGETDFIPLPE